LAGQYDHNALTHLLIEANLREAAMQEQFDLWRVVPYTVVYEDLIASYEATVRGLLDFLRIPGHQNLAVPQPAFDRLADEVSESWHQRFRHTRKAEPS
jgi:trehalose 2-sulfotransferase